MSVDVPPTRSPVDVRLQVEPASAPPTLDDAQQRVVDHIRGPMLVLAGPGTGKTATICEAVVARVRAGMPSDRIAVLTFSRTAARELSARIAGRLGGAAAPEVSTFHSFAWRLLGRLRGADDRPTRLLTGPEQDAAVREMLRDPGPWADLWPARSRDALASPALAAELVGLMAAARAHGWEPADVAAHADDGPDEWRAAAGFFEEYLDVMGLRGALDYAELVHQATVASGSNPQMRGWYRAIYVDEYQDTDPAQVALLRTLITAGSTVVAVGDPDQAIYRFRGADVGGIFSFAEDFADAGPCATEVLDRTRRFGPGIRAVADAWIESVGLGTLPVSARRRHRSPECVGPPSDVSVRTFPDAAAQARGVADVVRRARFDAEHPLAWRDMAVLVRSGTLDIPLLAAAMLDAGVPVEVPPGERPLADDDAVQPFLEAVRVAARPETATGAGLEFLLCSPLIGFTPVGLRRLQRGLRRAERARAESLGESTRPIVALMRELLHDVEGRVPGVPEDLEPLVDTLVEMVTKLRGFSGSPSEALWHVWAFRGNDDDDGGGTWARALRRDALAGGVAGHRADMALDAIVELFRVAERAPSGMSPMAFVQWLVDQRLPAARPDDPGSVRDAVRLMTAHRSKGGQWPLVVVAGVQQDSWPAVRLGGSLLEPERIGRHGLRPAPTSGELLADERRLAFVAATRARQRLVVTAVSATDPDQPQASVLVAEAAAAAGLIVDDEVPLPVEARGLNSSELVAELRTVVADPGEIETTRVEAARLLRHLATARNPAVAPVAAPGRWWGLREPSEGRQPFVDPSRPVPLSASTIDAITECPLKWFIVRRLGAGRGRTAHAAFGSAVHAAAAALAQGAELNDVLDQVEPMWGDLGFPTDRERRDQWLRAQADLRRFARWLAEQPPGRRQSEVRFSMGLTAEGSSALIHGAIDLLHMAPDGAVRVVDIKTSPSAATGAQAKDSTQLGTYQLALFEDAVPGWTGLQPGGGTLLYIDTESRGRPKERDQPRLDDASWLVERIGSAALSVRAERVTPTPGTACRTCDAKGACPVAGPRPWLDERGV